MYRIQHSFISSIILLWLMIPHLGVTVFAQDYCDPELKGVVGDPLSYKIRGDRCEGRYDPDVDLKILFVASLTEFFEEYDLRSKDNLILEWSAPDTDRVHLRAEGIRRKLYYRMDTVSDSASYSWPMDVLKGLAISQGDVGVVGWTRHTVGGNQSDVYLPLRIRQKEKPSPTANYRVVLFSDVELTEVYISLALVGDDGHPRRFLMEEEALDKGYYPAKRKIEFLMPSLETPGFYSLEIGVTFSTSEPFGIKRLFYHHGGNAVSGGQDE